jgi:hypothetical protein
MKQLLMIKKIAILLICILFSFNLFAQRINNLKYSFRLGLTAYPTFGYIKAENGKNNGTSLGFAYGLLGDFNFEENLSFSTGLTITTINGKSTEINAEPYNANVDRSSPVAFNLKYKMQYLEVPLTIKFKNINIANKRWYAQLGIANDFRINATQNAEVDGNEIANDINAKGWTKFYRAGLIIGAGAEFDLNNQTILVTGLTLNNGITNVSSVSENVRNHFVGLNLAVFF